MIWLARFSLMAVIASSLWLQLIESLCIYNNLKDNFASLVIIDERYGDK